MTLSASITIQHHFLSCNQVRVIGVGRRVVRVKVIGDLFDPPVIVRQRIPGCVAVAFINDPLRPVLIRHDHRGHLMPVHIIAEREPPPVAVTDHARRPESGVADAADHIRRRGRIAPDEVSAEVSWISLPNSSLPAHLITATVNRRADLLRAF